MTCSSEKYWDCKQCGACCKFFRLPVRNEKELVKQFINHFGFELETYDIEVSFKGKCKNLINNKCSIYENRPELCKEFYCKRHCKEKCPDGLIYEKRCRVCQNVRKFQAGTDRDFQSVCGNCWNW